MIKFGVKLGVAGGAAYYLADQGVWKSNEEAVVICKNITKTVAPYTNEITKQIPYEMPNLPDRNEISYLAKYYWNRGVMATFAFLADVPDLACSYTTKGIKAIKDNKEFQNLLNSKETKPQEISKEKQ